MNGYTNHVKADQNDMDNLSKLLAAAGVNFLIGVPVADIGTILIKMIEQKTSGAGLVM